MKICLFTDPHWAQYSSILRRRGEKYSQRLENLIQSVSWAEDLSKRKNCDMVICPGDFFDSAFLNSEEATALQDVRWNLKIPHYFLVGNHESPVASLKYSSTKVLEAFGFKIISDVTGIDYHDENTGLILIPYILEEDRKPLKEYLEISRAKRKIVFSHNDIKGIRYGKFESKEGFDLADIENNCDLFINGHLHNSGFLNNKETILNLGNLTGQNFSEDASIYSHYACILDTETLELTFYENPHAFNFYKVEIIAATDIEKIDRLKNNAVVTFRCKEELVESLQAHLMKAPNIIESRIIIYRDIGEETMLMTPELSLNGMDYLEKFSTFILNTLGDSEIIREELTYVSGGIR